MGLKCRPLNCAYCGSCDSSTHKELVCLKFPGEVSGLGTKVDHGLGFALIYWRPLWKLPEPYVCWSLISCYKHYCIYHSLAEVLNMDMVSSLETDVITEKCIVSEDLLHSWDFAIQPHRCDINKSSYISIAGSQSVPSISLMVEAQRCLVTYTYTHRIKDRVQSHPCPASAILRLLCCMWTSSTRMTV